MAVDARRDLVERALADGDGILRAGAGVGRPGLPAAGPPPRAARGRLRPRRARRDLRALARRRPPRPTTASGPPDEGLSYLALDGPDADHAEGRGRGRPRSRSWGRSTRRPTTGLGRLAKIFDYGSAAAAAPAPAAGARGARRPPLEGRGLLLPARRRHGAAPGDVPRRASVGRRGAEPRAAAAVPRGWDSDLILQHSVGYLQVAERGLPHPVGRAARAGDRAHDRAAGGLGRLRDAPGAERRARSSRRSCSGRTCGPRTARRRASGSSSS